MKNIWYKSHNINIRFSELPLFEIIIFLEFAAGLLAAFLLTLIPPPNSVFAVAGINFLVYAYHAEVIRILIRKTPLLYKSNKIAYLRHAVFIVFQKSDLLLLGLSKTFFLIVFTFGDSGLLMLAAADVLLSAAIVLFFLLETELLDLPAKLLLVGILIISYLALDRFPSGILVPGFMALSVPILAFTAIKIGQYRKIQLCERKNGRAVKNPTINFLFKGSFYNFKKNIFSFATLIGAGVLLHHFSPRIGGISGLFIILTLLEAIVYAQIELYEKNIGHSSVLFYSQRKSTISGILLGNFSYRCFPHALALIVLVGGGFMRSPLHIAACALWFFFLLLYVTKISEKIVAYRKKRPRFIEEYAAFMTGFWVTLMP